MQRQQEKELRVPKVRQWLHRGEKSDSSPSLRVRRRAQIQMPVLRYSQQAKGTRERAHT